MLLREHIMFLGTVISKNNEKILNYGSAKNKLAMAIYYQQQRVAQRKRYEPIIQGR